VLIGEPGVGRRRSSKDGPAIATASAPTAEDHGAVVDMRVIPTKYRASRERSSIITRSAQTGHHLFIDSCTLWSGGGGR